MGNVWERLFATFKGTSKQDWTGLKQQFCQEAVSDACTRHVVRLVSALRRAVIVAAREREREWRFLGVLLSVIEDLLNAEGKLSWKDVSATFREKLFSSQSASDIVYQCHPNKISSDVLSRVPYVNVGGSTTVVSSNVSNNIINSTVSTSNSLNCTNYGGTNTVTMGGGPPPNLGCSTTGLPASRSLSNYNPASRVNSVNSLNSTMNSVNSSTTLGP